MRALYLRNLGAFISLFCACLVCLALFSFPVRQPPRNELQQLVVTTTDGSDYDGLYADRQQSLGKDDVDDFSESSLNYGLGMSRGDEHGESYGTRNVNINIIKGGSAPPISPVAASTHRSENLDANVANDLRKRIRDNLNAIRGIQNSVAAASDKMQFQVDDHTSSIASLKLSNNLLKAQLRKALASEAADANAISQLQDQERSDVSRLNRMVVALQKFKAIPGPRGQTGRPGPPGPRGAVGSVGPRGPRGLPGLAVGHDGKDGLPGRDGRDGLPGQPGPRGYKGDDGARGPRGFTGSVGPAGPRGQPGNPGLSGHNGKDGRPGVNGRPGPAGARGLPGRPGSDGHNGKDGRPGVNGRPGLNGARGFPGLQGRPGTPGKTIRGPQGDTGRIGPQGRAGSPGVDGRPGLPGAVGPKGSRGRMGPPGHDGNPQPLSKYSYGGWKFVTVDVDGPMTGHNVLAACAAKGMRTPCDHPAYCDGKCVVVDFTGHLSYNNDGRRPRDLWNGKYFYAANANQGHTLQSIDASHRWSDAGNEFGQTLCVQRRNPKVGKPIRWNGFTFTPFFIRGVVDNNAILATCHHAGLQVPCDHPSWNNGQCIVVNPHGHMSYAGHNDFPRDSLQFSYWFTGHANGFNAIQNVPGSHRWATPCDRDGISFCVKRA